MTDKQLCYLFRAIKYIFMLGLPAGYAIVKWGFTEAPTNDTPTGRWALGAFIAFILIGQFVIDLIKHYIEQYKLSNKISFMRNHAFMYLIVGVIMLGANYIAWDAYLFCRFAFISSLLAYVWAFIEKHYYKKWKGVTNE